MRRFSGLLALLFTLVAAQLPTAPAQSSAGRREALSVTNTQLRPCLVDVTGEPGETDVMVSVLSSLSEHFERLARASAGDASAFDDLVVVETASDEDGYFTADLPAPVRPGQHLTTMTCNHDAEDLARQLAEPLDGSGEMMTSLVRVGQPRLALSLNQPSAEAGETVEATVSWCQAENDFELAPLVPELAGLSEDFPDLSVFVDGQLVAQVPASERYPSGSVKVPLTFHEPGEHVVEAHCRHQTVELLDLTFAGLGSIEIPDPLQYPVGAALGSPVRWDEEVLSASTIVRVAAPSDDRPPSIPTPPTTRPAPPQDDASSDRWPAPPATPVPSPPRYLG